MYRIVENDKVIQQCKTAEEAYCVSRILLAAGHNVTALDSKNRVVDYDYVYGDDDPQDLTAWTESWN